MTRRARWLFVALSLAAGPVQAAMPAAFTVDEGTNFALALSPDKSTFAIDLQGKLWLVPAKGGPARRLADLAGGEARYPAWSPDGTRIAFQYFIDDQWRIYTIGRDGGDLAAVTAGAADDQEPVWAPDGKSIYFSSDRAGTYDIWRVDVTSGALAQMTADPAEEFQPAVSPDGRTLAFIMRKDGTDALHIRDAAGAVRTLIAPPEPAALPSWSADGKSIAYVTFARRRPVSSLQVVDVATGRAEVISESGEDTFVSRPAWVSATQLAYSADGHIKRRVRGQKAEVVPFSAEFAVTKVPSYTRKDHKFTSREPRRALGLMSPVVSPDGSRVAFIALGDLWLLKIGDPKPQRLTNDSFMEIEPAWSPDGTQLAYISDRRGVGTMDLYLRDMKSGRDRRITETIENLSMPVFSPDGGKIAVHMAEAADWHSKYPHVLDLKTGELRKVHGWLFKPSLPSWSADGSTLAMVAAEESSRRDRKGLNKVLLVPLAEGAAPRFVTPTPGKSLAMRESSGAIWSPDGTQMAFVQDGLLWTVATNGTEFVGTPRLLTRELAEYASWTGDSKSIVYLAVDTFKRVSLEDGHVETIPLDLTWTPAIPKGRKVVRAGRLFDGVSDAYRENVDIVIDDNRITEIVPRRDAWAGAEIIDAAGKTVVPGLFENHIHNFSVNGEITGRVALSYGVTSLREPGANPTEGVESREAWASGRRPGPRLFTTGLLEGGRIYYGMSLPISSTAYLEMELDRARRLEYDLIKTYERLGDAHLKRTIDFGHEIGIPVTSHDLYPAAVFGADAVEHVDSRDRWDHSDRLSADGKLYNDVLQMHVHSGMAMVPTAIGYSPVMGAEYLSRKGRALKDVAQYASLPPKYFEERWVKAALAGQFTLNDPQFQQGRAAIIKRFFDAGVSIPTGTDTSFFNIGFGIITEMQLYVDAGLQPSQAIQFATIRAAALNGVDDVLGSIEPGKLADLVVVDGDPLSNVMDLVNVVHVLKDGNHYRIEDLLSPGKP